MGIRILEVSHITPSTGAGTEQTLPLLHFDIAWIPVQPTETVYFYDYKHTESHFSETLVPNLKKSLSLALNHFLPLAGNIVFPLSSALPFSHYLPSEASVPLTISISDSDFFNLTSNHPKGVVELHELVSPLPDAVRSPSSITFSVLALRVTLFPSRGLCIGMTHHHADCDGASLMGPFGFFNAWASIVKHNGDSHCEEFLPSYDRTTIHHDASALTTSFWSHVRSSEPVVRPALPLPSCNLKATFELSHVELQWLKNILLRQEPALGQVSSYVALTAYVWSCLAQSATAGGENVDDDEDEYVSVSVDCRGRLTPPLPPSYFGNCLVFALARSTHGMLKGRLGFLMAARAIASAIQRIVNNERGIVARAEEEYLRRREVVGKRLIGVSGAHRVDRSSFDLGWGGVRKFDVLHVDYNKGISLNRTKQGFEVGLSMPKPKMDAFAAFFKKNLTITTSNM